MAECPAKCGTKVVFLKNDRSGNKNPINLVPDAKGNVTINWDLMTYHTLSKKELAQRQIQPDLFAEPLPRLFLTHLATCPNQEALHSCRVCHQRKCVCKK